LCCTPEMMYGGPFELAEQHGRGSVAQIGFEIGYSSEAAFSRAFKRQFGTSPATWRKQSL